MANKKAEIEYREIFTIIFVLVFAVLWIAFQNTKFKPAQEQFFDSEACRLSVLKASIPTQGVASVEELQGCKPPSIVTDETDQETVYNLLTNSVNDCWYRYGSGKVNFRKEFSTSIASGHILCLRCSKILFEENPEAMSRQSFETYLKESNKLEKIKNKFFVFDKVAKDDSLYTVFLTGRFDINELNKQYSQLKSGNIQNKQIFETIDSYLKAKSLIFQGVDSSAVLIVPKDSMRECIDLV
ncbi:MAG: hypothetical protein AABW58_00500 [Nanoarchaeota archaeon]